LSLFAVFYTYAEGSDDKRDEHRPAHRAFLRELHDAGKLKVCGPWGQGETPGGMLIFEGDSAAEIGELLDADPFYEVGVVAERSSRGRSSSAGSAEQWRRLAAGQRASQPPSTGSTAPWT
jgi:uncharacterized protein